MVQYFLDSPKVTYTEDHKDGKHTYTFTGPCKMSGKQQVVTVNGADLFKYRQGEFIQNAFPYLSDDQREWMISGMSGEEYDKLFPEED